MSGPKYVLLLAVLMLGASAAVASEEGSVPLKNLPVQEKLERFIDINFRGVTLSEALQFFRQTQGLNVVLDDSAASLADKPINLELKDVRVQDALTWTLQQAGLRYALVSGIVYVADRQHLVEIEPRTLRQRDVSDLMLDITQTGLAAGSASGIGASAGNSSVNKSSTGLPVATGGDLLNCLVMFSGPRHWDEVSVLNAAGISSSASGNSSIQKESRDSSL